LKCYEKTGYPAECWNSDGHGSGLRIDSIKRVEIIRCTYKQHPEMSGINPNELTELRTLGGDRLFCWGKCKKKSNGIGGIETKNSKSPDIGELPKKPISGQQGCFSTE